MSSVSSRVGPKATSSVQRSCARAAGPARRSADLRRRIGHRQRGVVLRIDLRLVLEVAVEVVHGGMLPAARPGRRCPSIRSAATRVPIGAAACRATAATREPFIDSGVLHARHRRQASAGQAQGRPDARGRHLDEEVPRADQRTGAPARLRGDGRLSRSRRRRSIAGQGRPRSSRSAAARSPWCRSCAPGWACWTACST